MIPRLVATKFPASRLGRAFNMRVGNGEDEIIFNAMFYGTCGTLIGATYNACAKRDKWNGKDIETRLENAIVGGFVGGAAGLLYPVTAIVSIGTSLSYLLDSVRWRFKITYVRDDRNA